MSRIAVISDVHSNLDALDAVVRDAGAVHGWWCLGDIVGYGPDPNEVIDRIQELGALCIRGNHDDGVMRPDQQRWFNDAARRALTWTAERLTDSSWRFLEGLSDSRIEDGHMLVHGSPRNMLQEYVVNAEIARASLSHLTEPVCFIGHTHIPSSFTQSTGSENVHAARHEHGERLALSLLDRSMLNSGSVGQPRDGNPRASYGILETDGPTFTWRRVEYDTYQVEERMRAAKLPTMLIDRLSEGW